MGLPSPQFGVPLAPNQINPELSWYPIYGVTPDDKYVPISITESGALNISGVTITGPVTVSDVTIKGVDPANSFTSQDVSVVNWGLNGYALRSSIFYDGNPLLVHPNGSIDVNLLSTGGGIPANDYVENLAVPPNSTTTLFTYVVPASTTYSLVGIRAWGTYDAEFLIQVNGANEGGGWTSPSNRTLMLDYGTVPIIASAGSTVTVTVTNYATSSQTFRLNALGELS
jgi:hypothetical protein